MKLNTCNVYIHDLELKDEGRVRRLFLMSGAEFATQVRFTDQLNNADIWILSQGSALLGFAQKRAAEQELSLLIYSDTQLHILDKSGIQPLSAPLLAEKIDKLIAGGTTNKATSTQVETIKIVIPDIAKQIHTGMRTKQGALCLGINKAIFLFDFAALVVRYNTAAYEMLWNGQSSSNSMANLVVLDHQNEPPSLGKHCSAFLAIWQMTRRLQNDELGNLLTHNTALKLDTWPPFEQVKHQIDDFRIASLLQKKSLSAQQVSELLGIDRSQVNQFFNAIYLSASGNIEFNQARQSLAQARQPSALSKLWRMMRKSKT